MSYVSCFSVDILLQVASVNKSPSFGKELYRALLLTCSNVGGVSCFLNKLLNPKTGAHSGMHSNKKMETFRYHANESILS